MAIFFDYFHFCPMWRQDSILANSILVFEMPGASFHISRCYGTSPFDESCPAKISIEYITTPVLYYGAWYSGQQTLILLDHGLDSIIQKIRFLFLSLHGIFLSLSPKTAHSMRNLQFRHMLLNKAFVAYFAPYLSRTMLLNDAHVCKSDPAP